MIYQNYKKKDMPEHVPVIIFFCSWSSMKILKILMMNRRTLMTMRNYFFPATSRHLILRRTSFWEH
jgi:hypothetical protein